jgi:hypothetical protein
VVIRERGFVIKMTKLIIKIAILIITNLYYAIFNPKGISVVYIVIMMVDFNVPIFNVFSVKKRYPFFRSVIDVFGCTAAP